MRCGKRSGDQRGAVAVFVAALLTVILGVAAFAVDLGMQRVARSDMQALADVVSLDLSRLVDGRGADAIITGTGTPGVMTLGVAKNASMNRNKINTVGDTATLTVTPYLVKLNMVPDANGDYFSKQPNGLPLSVSGTTVPDAVVVTATTKVSFGFANVLGVSSGSASRAAVATTQRSACFHLGSFAAAIDTQGSTLLGPLNGLLGLNLGLVSYQGLASSNVSLADLVATGQVGTTDQLLNTGASLGNLELATITALQNKNASGNNTAAITALNALLLEQSNQNTVVKLADLLSLNTTDSAALTAGLNVLDLIGGSVAVANGNHAVDVSNLNIAGLTGGLSVIQGRQFACGVPNDPKAHASASQISANLTLPLSNLPTGTPSVLGLSVTGSVSVTGGIGNAEGQLVGPPPAGTPNIVCRSGLVGSEDTYRVDVNGGLLGLGLQGNITLNGQVSTGLLGGLIDGLLGSLVKVTFDNVTIGIGSSAPGTSPSTQHADLKVPQNAANSRPPGTAVKTGSAYGGIGTVPNFTTTTITGGTITVRTGGILGLIGARNTTVSLDYGPISTLVGTLLGSLNSTVNSTVNNSLVSGLNNLLTPLGKLLGVNAGGADVFSHYRPSCNGVKLVG